MDVKKREKQIQLIAISIIIVSVLVLAGWKYDIEVLKSVLPDYVSMKVNTAIGFLLTGAILFLINNSSGKRYTLSRILSVLLLGLGVVTMMEYLLQQDYGIDEYFVIDKVAAEKGELYRGRMSNATAFCFALLGLGFLGITIASRKVRTAAQYMFHVVSSIALIAIIGYLFNVPGFYKLSFLSSMALHTSLLFMIGSVVATMFNPTLGLAKLFSGKETGNIMARRLFPLMCLLVIFLGFLRIESHRLDIVSVEFGIALFALSFIFVSLFLIMNTADKLNKIDRKKAQAEEDLRLLNASLEQKINERSEELRKMSERMILATSAAKMGTWDWDIVNDILVWDKEMFRIYGVPEESFTGSFESWRNVLHPDDLEAAEIAVGQALKNEQELDTEFRVVLADNSIRHVKAWGIVQHDKNGNPTRMVGTNIDVTSQKKANEKFKSLLESAPDAMVIVNTQGAIELANNQVEKIFGYTKTELIGRSIEILIPERFKGKHPGHRHHFFASPNRRSMGTGMELFAARKDGVEFQVEISLSPIETEDGLLVCAAIRDVTERKVAENELRESNERNKIFVEQAPNALAMFDNDMNYIAASQKWYEDYGLTGRDIIGKSHYEIFPEIGEDWKQYHRECLQGAINQNDNGYFLRADGTEQWLVWDVRPWYISKDKIGGLLMYTADITKSKKTEQQLRISEEQFRSSFEYSATGMAIISKEGKWIKVNDTVCKILGYSADELKTKTFQDITYPDDLDADLELLQELIEGKRPYYIMEKRYVHKSGHTVWAILSVSSVKDDKGDLLYFTSQITDINNQKITQEKLESTLAQLEGLLDASTHVSIIGTDVNGMITVFNKGAENLLGYTREEMVMKQTPAIIHVQEEMEARGKELTERTGKKIEGFDVFTEVAKKEKYETREWTYVNKDGSHFPVQLTVTAVKERNEITGYLGVAANISEIKNVEREIKSLLEVTKDQNERLKNFAHIVSHNLRSHSSNLSILTDLFLQENPGMEGNDIVKQHIKAFDNLQETIEHLNEVVLINTTVGDNLKYISLNKALSAAIDSVVALAKDADVTIHNNVNKHINILGIEAYLDSILLNFLTNAIKYRSAERDSYVKLSTVFEPNYVVLSIEDNGLGMNLKTVQHKLFGMYKTFHGNKDARGIGLFISKNQVEAIGGKITVDSEEGKGTTFKLYFKYEKS